MLLCAGLVSHQRAYHQLGGYCTSNPPYEAQEPSPALGYNGTKEKGPAGDSKQDQENEDLIAQQSMAGAAWAAVRISVVGLIGLMFTVAFAGLAWWEARKSAKADNEALEFTRIQLNESRVASDEQASHMNRQVGAMQDMARASQRHANITRAVSEKQSMAYVHASSAKLKTRTANALAVLDPGRSDRFQLKIDNVGATIANEIRVRYGFDAATTQDIHALPPQPLYRGSIRNLAPNSSDIFTFGWQLHEAWEAMDKMPIIETSDIFRVFGEVRYRTVYDRPFKSQFMFWIPPMSLAPDQELSLFDNPQLGLAVFQEIVGEDEQQHDE